MANGKPGRPRKIMPELAEAIQEAAAAETGERVAIAGEPDMEFEVQPVLEPPVERVARVIDDPSIEFKVEPALEPHPSDREASPLAEAGLS